MPSLSMGRQPLDARPCVQEDVASGRVDVRPFGRRQHASFRPEERCYQHHTVYVLGSPHHGFHHAQTTERDSDEPDLFVPSGVCFLYQIQGNAFADVPLAIITEVSVSQDEVALETSIA